MFKNLTRKPFTVLLSTALTTAIATASLTAANSYAATTASPAPAQPPAVQSQQVPAQAATRISINAANADMLAEHLVGIGPAKAEAIVAWRQQNGRFSDVEQLLKIKGIGAATLNKNKHLITL